MPLSDNDPNIAVKSTGQAKTVASVMLIMLAGKAAGFLREILISNALGTGNVAAEAYNYASQFPNTFLDVLFASAFTASFIPVFSGYMRKRGRNEAFELANGFITLSLIITAAVTIILMSCSSAVMGLLIGGNSDKDFVAEVIKVGVPLLRTMLPTIVLSAAAYAVTGILQAMDRFNAPAAMSLASNLIIITYFIFFYDRFGITGLAAAFLIGWGGQLLILLPSLRKTGFRYKPRFNLKEPGLKEIGRLMIPVMISSWVIPINIFVNEVSAASVAGGAALRRGYTLYSVITGVLVFSVTNVLFTKFSKQSAASDNAALGESVTGSAKGMLFVLLPLSAGIFVLAYPLIHLVFERGAFTAESTAVTGAALRYYALGMAGFGLHNVLTKAFFALKKAWLPLIASLAAIMVNAALSYALVGAMGTGGPALSSSISITLASLILLVALARDKTVRIKGIFGVDLGKTLVVSVTMAVVTAIAYDTLTVFIGSGGWLREALILVLTVLASVIWYAFGVVFLRVKEATDILTFIKNRRKVSDSNGSSFTPNVLMVTMAFNIGGAETHILELAKALHGKGVAVTVASAGGDYVKEIEDCGIRHITVPLNSKQPGSVLKSYRVLKRTVKDNGINIIHAHARFPAFICGFLCKRLGVRFVTTAHLGFKSTFPYNLLSNWGEATLAVSDDIRDYLASHYGVDTNRVIITVNGVDTGKFHPDIDGSHIVNEFDLSPDKIRLTSISRLDESRSLAAKTLIEIAPELDRLYKNQIEILIVGDGDDAHTVINMAEEANKRIGRRMVILAGRRTDISAFLSKDVTDIMVNVSRSALEAMAAAIPVILSGNEGYQGILTEENAENAAESNFCCRIGCPMTNPELLLNDIIKLINADKEELRKQGIFNREFVKARYSVERMAEDALAVYAMISRPQKRYDAVLSGYYGSGNSGDDEILAAIIDALRETVPGAKIAVLSRNPGETAKGYGVKAIHTFNVLGMYKALKNANLLISGGGTLMQDQTSTKSLLYYLFVINQAKRLGCKVMLYASGVGPLNLPKNRTRAAKALKTVDLITLRDDLSLVTLNNIGVTGVKAVVTADTVFGLKYKNSHPIKQLLDNLGIGEKPYFCVAIRNWKALPEGFEKETASFIRYMDEHFGLTAVYIAMQPRVDMDISKRVMALSGRKGVILTSPMAIDDMLAVVGSAKLTVAMRLHTIIYSAIMGTPVLGLSYDPKVNGIIEMLGQSRYCLGLAEVTASKLEIMAEDLIKESETVSAELLNVSGVLGNRALSTAQLAADLIYRRDINV